jgi:hypothetical protein
MRNFVFPFLFALGFPGLMRASTVSYAEGSYIVPDYTTEVPADAVQGYDPNPEGRSFIARDAAGQVYLMVSSYRDTSQVTSEQAWALFAASPEQRLIQEMQASFTRMPAGEVVTVNSAKAEVKTHKLVSVATITDAGGVSKLVTAILVLRNQKSLHLEIYVHADEFEQLLPEMLKIVDSLMVSPGFSL